MLSSKTDISRSHSIQPHADGCRRMAGTKSIVDGPGRASEVSANFPRRSWAPDSFLFANPDRPPPWPHDRNLFARPCSLQARELQNDSQCPTQCVDARSPPCQDLSQPLSRDRLAYMFQRSVGQRSLRAHGPRCVFVLSLSSSRNRLS